MEKINLHIDVLYMQYISVTINNSECVVVDTDHETKVHQFN